MKPVIRGLIDRQGEPPKGMLSAVHAYVVKLNWADIQAVQGGPITANNVIDKAIARVRQPDYTAIGMKLKLRIFAGVGAPEWAKNLGGAPVPYVDAATSGAGTGTIPRFWTVKYLAAYADLQSKLAALYDKVPEIRELTLSATGTFFDEPLVRQPVPANRTALLAAGYTLPADQNAILHSYNAHLAWKNTTTDVDFSPFPDVVKGGFDMKFTLDAITETRAVLGQLGGLQNNALCTDKLAVADFVTMYSAMHTTGAPIVFQTAAKSRIGDVAQVFAAAVQYGAGSVELPQGYPAFGLPTLTAANKSLGG